MVTIYNQEYKKDEENNETLVVELRGLSTDEKPTTIGDATIGNGSMFIEIDTGKIYMYDLENEQWKEM